MTKQNVLDRSTRPHARQRQGSDTMGEVASHRRPLPTRESPDQASLSCFTSPSSHGSRQTSSKTFPPSLPETEVRLVDLKMDDPRDFEQVYGALHEFARAYEFDTEREEYLIHITTGTHVCADTACSCSPSLTTFLQS